MESEIISHWWNATSFTAFSRCRKSTRVITHVPPFDDNANAVPGGETPQSEYQREAFCFFSFSNVFSMCCLPVKLWPCSRSLLLGFTHRPSQFYELMLPMGTNIKDFSSYYQIACLCRASDPSELQIIILTEENTILSQLQIRHNNKYVPSAKGGDRVAF